MKKVIITGCSRGIGFELARAFAVDGHNVLAVSRNDGPIKALNDNRIASFPFDISSEADLARLLEYLERNWKSVDILINNAGQLVNKPFAETTMEDFENVFQVNFFGVARLIQLLLPMIHKNGHVVNISSMGGVQGSVKFPGLSAYSSSKGALVTLTEMLAEEYKDEGPSFNVLALGAVQTEMLEEAFPGFKAPVTAEEMADFIKSFALDGQRFFNGKLLPVSNSTP